MKVLGISGKMCSGKDYTADIITDLVNKEYPDYSVDRKTFAYFLREELEYYINTIQGGNAGTLFTIAHTSDDNINKLVDLVLTDPDYNTTDYSIFKRISHSRELLQFWGTDVRRAVYPDYWAEKVYDYAIKEAKENGDKKLLIISDVRFENEANTVKKLGGEIIRMEVDRETQLERIGNRPDNKFNIKGLTHPSETALDDYKDFDYILPSVDNQAVEVFAEDLIKKYFG